MKIGDTNWTLVAVPLTSLSGKGSAELGIDVIAEGVENEAQARFLISSGCQSGQGYLFSRPVNARRFTELLRQRIIPPSKPSNVTKIRSAA